MNTTFDLRPFRPVWWLPGRHAQTLGGRFLRAGQGVEYRRERLTTPDDDFLEVDFEEPAREATMGGPPIVVLLHGLEGCSDSGYMREAAKRCASVGFRVAALNFRGRSGPPNRRPRAYHAGETGDLAFLLRTLAERSPESPLAAIGFSLGGNVLLKYLGEADGGGRPKLTAAAVVSAPFDLASSTSRLERGMGRLYTRYFLRSLRRGVRAKSANGPLPYDQARALRARSLREFDEVVTAPLHGFLNAADYYERSSSKRYLRSIGVPTLILHARDDPFHPVTPEQEAAVASNPALCGGFVDRGGHVGFVGGSRWGLPRFWAEEEAVRFVAACLREPPQARTP